MKVTVTQTSPFGRRGDTVEVDPESERVQKYLDRGLLAPLSDDEAESEVQTPSDPDEGSEADSEVQGEPSVDGSTVLFDPSEHTVREVKAYLHTADEAEFNRVLDAETNGLARASLIG